MDTRNCCSGCAGVNNVYSCSSPIRRVSVAPSHTRVFHTKPVAVAVKKEESVSQGNALAEAMPKATVVVKKETENQVVGWLPIRSYRMNTLFNHATMTSNVDEEKGVGGDKKNESSKKKINHGGDKCNDAIKERGHLGFVKVNMDGLPIGRKVDLNSHKSYQTLAKTLEDMFFNPSLSTRGGKEQGVQPLKLLDESSEFVLTYEDKEVDWMLVGDVPWGMFLNTVKRFRIMRTSEANRLAPKSQERNEKQKSKLI